MPCLLPKTMFSKAVVYIIPCFFPLKERICTVQNRHFLFAIYGHIYKSVFYTLNQHNHAMESTIGLRFSTLPNQYSICMPSGFHAARATKPHLSFSHSSLSLPQSSRNRPIKHIRGPVTCMLDGSLPPTYYRVDKGRASMASASPFLHNIGSGRWTNHKGNAAQIDGHSLAGVPLPGTTSIDHYIEVLFHLIL